MTPVIMRCRCTSCRKFEEDILQISEDYSVLSTRHPYATGIIEAKIRVRDEPYPGQLFWRYNYYNFDLERFLVELESKRYLWERPVTDGKIVRVTVLRVNYEE